MITTAPKTELTLDYSIEKIKSCIRDISDNKVLGCAISDQNELFNTFRLVLSKGISKGVMSISMAKTGEEKTQCTFETINIIGGYAPVTVLRKLHDNFLNTLSAALNGRLNSVVEFKEDKSKESRNNLTFVLVSLIVAVVVIVSLCLYVANTK